jgi:hypothetical protein
MKPRTTLYLSLALCLASGLTYRASAQEPANAPAGATAPEKPNPQPPASPKPRRFSFGVYLSFLPQGTMPSGTSNQTLGTNYTLTSKTASTLDLFGGGAAVQVALTKRISFTADYVLRKTNFEVTNTFYQGVDDSTTSGDERTKTTVLRSTTAYYTDLPLLVRYRDPIKKLGGYGRNLFLEGGVAFRRVHNIHSYAQTTANDGTVTCCDETPLKPTNQWLTGFVAGAGYEFLDDFRIHFVPEFRYTRWMGYSLETPATRTMKNQLEVSLSFTF